MEYDEKPKKRPGRPKKPVVENTIEILGVVTKPMDADDVIELVYCKPILFTKLLKLCKQIAASEIEMLFTESGLHMLASDHVGKSDLSVFVDGNCLNSYYCKTPMRACVTRDSFARALSGLGNTHDRMTIVFKESDCKSTMYLIIHDREYLCDETYKLDVTYKKEEPSASENDDTDYPIKFNVTSKYFKNRINHIKNLSKTVVFQKIGDHFMFTFDGDHKIDGSNHYSNEKICLTSSLAANELFRVGVPVDYIKPFANSNIGKQVYIAAHQKKKISLMTLIDQQGTEDTIRWTFVVKMYTVLRTYEEIQ